MDLKDVPEFYEVDLGECLISRTETLGELSSPAVRAARTPSPQCGCSVSSLALSSYTLRAEPQPVTQPNSALRGHFDVFQLATLTPRCPCSFFP